MSHVIIDPPVGPFSPREEIQSWIDSLEARRAQHAGDEDALASIDRNVSMARRWLELRAPDE